MTRPYPSLKIGINVKAPTFGVSELQQVMHTGVTVMVGADERHQQVKFHKESIILERDERDSILGHRPAELSHGEA